MERVGVVSWPKEAEVTYVAEGYWREQPLGALLWQWAEERGGRIALVDGERRLSYRELAETADALAENLAGQGLKDGDNLLVQLPNSWELVVLLLACFRLGVAPVMMLPAHRDYELSGVGGHTRVAAIAVPDLCRGYDHQALAARVSAGFDWPCLTLVSGTEVNPGNVDLRSLTAVTGDVAARRARLDAAAPNPGDVAVFLLSGGTTGLSKVIARTHNDYEYNARQSGAVCGLDEDTVYLVALPAGHNFPLASPGILGTLMVGGRVVMLPTPSPRTAFATIARERVTTVAAVPAVVQHWTTAVAEFEPDLSSLKLVQVGGSLFAPEDHHRAVKELGCHVQQSFGMAEGLLNYTRFDDDPEVVATTQGRPISPHDEVLIVDEDGRPVPAGESGELLTRGPYTPRGYFNAPEHNARAFTADGWYRTGDVVRIDPASGNFVVTGRIKDLINRGGEKISADEVERLVLLLDHVAEAAAVAAPDPVMGERVCLYVTLHPGGALELDDLKQLFARHQVAAFKVPERIEVVAEMPYTAVGKIDKKVLRQLAAAVPAGQ
ncbi:(2,3-dihydroxybenzoyl)adenylate synthase [Kitasatospora sp. NPDC051853]|uniref:(2,3-dihydroxybenzoyl)adenylate synthase n=1 Tax=Kitasatospora sp. NPDC051853 TaxID=3364058 RepID=UPI00378ED6B0